MITLKQIKTERIKWRERKDRSDWIFSIVS